MKRCIYLYIGFCLIIGQERQENAGAFLRVGQSAQYLALGNAGIANEHSAALFYYNPSQLAFEEKSILGINSSFLSLDRRVYSLAYHHLGKKKVRLAFGWIYATVNDVFAYDLNAQNLGEISVGSNAFYGSAAFKVSEKLAIGLTAKYISEKLSELKRLDDYSASGIALDLSGTYELSPKLRVAVMLKDLAGKLSSNSETLFEPGLLHEENLPFQLIFGLKSNGLFDLDFAADFNFLLDYRRSADFNSFHFGVEAVHFSQFPIRIGINDSKLTAGFGLEMKLFDQDSRLDYAFISETLDAGNSHVISWNYFF